MPQTTIEIPQDSNLSWMTLFYALPKESVEKSAAYLNLPRNIKRLLASEEYKQLIKSDAFLELVWDCYAWSAWQFFQVPKKDGSYQDIPGDWSHYSGDFPLWRWSEEVLENGVMLDGDMLYEIEDPHGQFEEKVIGEMHIDQFKSSLAKQDRLILQMRYERYSLKEIAEKVGFKTPSAVAKRIEKIAGSHEDFVGDEYSSFLDKHAKREE